MRQSQQNRRGRGRGGNNRKGQNPLTRSYESNGPDVKIRGTPSHIAEKYVTMARDALSAGDPVLAENYLQHAEHYNRIIMTHREQQVSQSSDHAGSSGGRGRGHSSESNEEEAAVTGDEQVVRSDTPPPGSEPQPTLQSTDTQSEERPRRRSSSRDRSSSSGGEGERNQDRPSGRGRGRRSRYSQSDDQPDFLKRPVRRPRSTEATEDAPEAPVKSDEAAE